MYWNTSKYGVIILKIVKSELIILNLRYFKNIGEKYNFETTH